MNDFLRHLARAGLLWLLLAAAPAWAALSCTITAAPTPIKGIYTFWSNLDIQGSFTVTCTRAPGDATRPWIWIGIDQPTGGLTIPRDIGGSQLTGTIYRRNFGNGIWTNTGNQGANSNAAGGLRVRLDMRNRLTVTENFNFYFRVPWFQIRPAGVYLAGPIPVTLRLNNDGGSLLNTTSVSALISIQDNCRFSTDPAPVSVSYTAFAAAAIVRTSTFALTCTQDTDYTIALDAPRGVVPNVDIAYTAAVSASGTLLGTAVAQSYDVIFTFPPGQAGTCTAASCSGLDTRTITVTY